MNNKQWDAIWVNGTVATLESGAQQPFGLVTDSGLAVQAGKIAWVGKMVDLPAPAAQLAREVHDLKGKCVTPGLIDCHTHLVYGGNRSHEFELRLQGATYEAITRAGGGIRSTVTATRQVSEEELFQQSVRRAQAICAAGVTTLEIKSGYGLDLETELKMLRVAKRIEKKLHITVIKTFLGAHTVPAEYQGRAEDYVHFVCEEVLPRVAEERLAEIVDVFCENIAFDLAQTERIFQAAKKYNLAVKCHAEQLSNSGAAALAAKYQALSVDHLEFLTAQGVQALAKAGTVAVLLPGAFYFLREKQLPPIELLRKHHVPMAIATDCNPGTSPVTSLLLIMNMACTLFRLTPEEAFAGVTRHAAAALGLSAVCGTLSVGKAADFVVWDIKHPLELTYNVGLNPCEQVIRHGVLVMPAKA